MKGLIVFVDLFSLLAITLFVNFILAIGSGGRNEEVMKVTLVEMIGNFRAYDGAIISTNGILEYSGLLEINGKQTDIGTVIQTEIVGGHRFVIRGAPEDANLKVLISKISPSAFFYESQTIRLKRVYPGVESISYVGESVGAADVYRMALQ